MFAWLTRRRRARILEGPFPSEWAAIIDRNVPLAARLTAEEKSVLRDKTRIFLAEKNFEGCGGLELDDEIRVTIAAQACLLVIGLDEDEVYPGVESICVYPSAYRVPAEQSFERVVPSSSARHGEAWKWGTVVLSWDAARRGARDPNDGHNVVVHEFAHALDFEDGSANGAPPLHERAMYSPWARVLGAAFERLVAASERGAKTVLDPYGASSPAEFFAVASEAFFEKPQQMKRKHPALYEQLSAFYRQDPAER